MNCHMILWRYPSGPETAPPALPSFDFQLWMGRDLFELTAGPGRHSVSET